MSETAAIESMMRRIRAAVVPASARDVAAAAPPSYVDVELQPTFVADPHGHYALRDLLAYHDAYFVRVAFLSVLQREPDVGGFAHFVDELRSGISKVEILGRLRYSAEGRVRGVQVDGLRFRFALQRAYRLPLAGGLLRLAAAIVQLPANTQNQRVFEAHMMQMLERVQQATAASAARQHEGAHSLARQLRDLSDGVTSSLAANSTVVAAVMRSKADTTDVAGLRDEIGSVAARIHEQAAAAQVAQRRLEAALAERSTRGELATLSADLTAMIEARALRVDVDPMRHRVIELFAAIRVAREDAQLQMDAATAALRQALESKATLAAFAEVRDEVHQLAKQDRARGAQVLHQAEVLKGLVGAARAEARDDIAVGVESLRRMIESKAPAADLEEIAAQVRRMTEAWSALEAKASVAALDEIAAQVERFSAATTVQSRLAGERMVALESLLAAASAEARTERAQVEEVWDAALRDVRVDLVDQGRRLARLLDEAGKRLPAPLAADQLLVFANEGEHGLDALYAALEDRFRGTRPDVRQRQSVYLPRVKAAKAGRRTAPIVDLGCGRGEWLELLRDEGLVGVGVDLNKIFLADCAGLALDVVEQDAVAYLASLAPNSVGAITSFHLIEHLPLKSVIALLDEAHRVLRPGGILVLETPNPSNLVVGACNFYLDPTHRNPLPPELTCFLMEARGFADVEVTPLHPVDADWLRGNKDPMALTLNHFLFGAQDYGVIGRKA